MELTVRIEQLGDCNIDSDDNELQQREKRGEENKLQKITNLKEQISFSHVAEQPI